MKEKFNKICNYFDLISARIILYLSIGVFTGLAILNTLITAYFDSSYREWTKFRIDNIVLIGLLFVITVFIFLIIDHKIAFTKKKEIICIAMLLVFTLVVCIVWVNITHSTPVADRLFVSMAASNFLNGDYFDLSACHYLFQYPYQLGITAFIELIYRAVGDGNFAAIQYLNSIAVCITFFSLYKITKLIFGDKVTKIVIFLLFGCLSVMFFCTYVYGNLFGLAFASFALWMELIFLEKRKCKYLIFSIVSICVSLLLKNNFMIVFIAMLLILIIDFFHNKQFVSILFAILMFVSSIFANSLLHSYYSYRSGMEINKGVPMVSFVAMGLQDGWFGKGTYNRYTVDTFKAANLNYDKTAKMSEEYIKERMSYFRKNPGKALSFFSEKIALQWTEPTYMSIWESNCSNNHDQELSSFTKSMYVGFWHNVVVGFMNFYQSLIWICAAFYLILKRKTINVNQMLLALVIIGGFICHIFWEAKSQYIIQYFVFAIPYAAAGLYEILQKSKKFLQKQYIKNK